VGFVPLLAVEVIDDTMLARMPAFAKRMQWFLKHRRDLSITISQMDTNERHGVNRRLLALPCRERLESALRYLLDENEFLSPWGIRSMSKKYETEPYVFQADGHPITVRYAPGDSTTGMFGGNSNWRGPVWMPLNYLLLEALERYYYFYGDSFLIEFPTGSGRHLNLNQVAREIGSRLLRIFLPGGDGQRACFGEDRIWAKDPHWNDLLLFHEYFHGDTGRGLGANHQTGWTAIVGRLLEDREKLRRREAANARENGTRGNGNHGNGAQGDGAGQTPSASSRRDAD
jgi:hypothetical protein